VASCPHEDAPVIGRACTHLIGPGRESYIEAFLGRGIEAELLCETCAEADDRSAVVTTCAACDSEVRHGGCSGFRGQPEVRIAESALRLASEIVVVPGCGALVDLQPITGEDRNRWIGLDDDGALHVLDLDTGRIERSVVHPAVRDIDHTPGPHGVRCWAFERLT
jgi:hypothetical protein